MPSYRKRGAYWQARWELPRDPETGKRRWDQKSGFPTRREAREWYERNVAGKALSPPSRLTVGEWLERWLEMQRDRKGQTYINYQQAVRNHLGPAFGEIRIRDLSPDRIRAWHVDLATRGYATSSIREWHRILSRAIGQAVRDGHAAGNPVRRVPPPKLTERGREVWSQAQIRHALDTFDETDPHEALLMTALLTGLRLAELVDLQWRDLDLERGTLTISHHQTRSADRRWISDTPKSRGSRRTISMPRRLRDLLHRERTRWVEKRLSAGASWRGTEYVFCHWDGRWLSRFTIPKKLDRFCQHARLPRLTVHDLRHSWATWMMELGVHPAVVQAGLGHSSVQITIDLYSHVTPGIAASSARAIDDALDAGRGQRAAN